MNWLFCGCDIPAYFKSESGIDDSKKITSLILTTCVCAVMCHFDNVNVQKMSILYLLVSPKLFAFSPSTHPQNHSVQSLIKKKHILSIFISPFLKQI